MKLKIGNKIFNFNQAGWDNLSPYIYCCYDLSGMTIISHFYFINEILDKRWFYSHRTGLCENNFTIDIDEFYKGLKSQLNIYSFNEEHKEKIINSIIDEKIRILL